ncbi:MAG: glycosyltransferase, partial [Planctomycetia bacterium]
MPFPDNSHVESAPREAAAAGRPYGINLIGHVTAALGLGVAARNTLAMLASSGRPFTAVDVDPGGGRQGADRSWSGALARPPAAPHAVNWFQLNPPEAGKLVAGLPRWLEPARHANVCVPFWELPRLPVTADWREWLGLMDLVLAPSLFIRDAIRSSLPDVPVVHYPQTVVLPAGVAARRADFGLPEDAILFHVVADGASDLARKNPVAAVRAFRAAFPDGGPVGLVIKLGGPRACQPWSDPAELVAEAAGHPGIHVVRRDLDYPSALSLAASCDVCVSLHRSEGLGLGLLEAMSLGKPVIATAWSGTMDFTTAEDSCLVGF